MPTQKEIISKTVIGYRPIVEGLFLLLILTGLLKLVELMLLTENNELFELLEKQKLEENVFKTFF